MKQFYFLYQKEDSLIHYIDLKNIGWNDAIHGFYPVTIVSTGGDGYFRLGSFDNGNISTFLTKDDFEVLAKYNESIMELGMSKIDKDSDEFSKGMRAYADIAYIIDKITSHGNHILHLKAVEKEKEKMGDIYNLTRDEVEEVFNHYWYQDMVEWNIIDELYNSVGEFLEDNISYYPNMSEQDIIDDVDNQQCYWILKSGKVVSYI